MIIQGTHWSNGEPRVVALVAGPVAEASIPLVIDTGSAVTALSNHHATAIGFQGEMSAEVNAMGIGGNVRCSAMSVTVFFLLEDRTYSSYAVDVLVLPASEKLPSILGRDILERMNLNMAVSLGVLRLETVDT